MHFPSGSWFDYGGRYDTTPCADVAAFREELTKQVAKYFHKREYKLDVFVDQQRLDDINRFAQRSDVFDNVGPTSGNKLQRAFLTFHGTSNPAALDSIARFGYLLPGEQHPRYGYALNMRVGNVFGDGVYSSSSVDVAMSYAATDRDDCAMLAINVVLPGRIAMVRRGGWYDNACRAPTKQFDLSERYNLAPNYETWRYDFADAANTLTPDHYSMWIVAHPQQITPVAFVRVPYARSWRDEAVKRDPSLAKAQAMTVAEASANAASGVITLTRLTDDYFALPASVYQARAEHFAMRSTFVVPQSLLFDKSFATALVHRIRTSGRGSHDDVIVFGGVGAVTVLKASGFEKALPSLLVRHKHHDLLSGVRAALDKIATMYDNVYTLLLIFADGGTTLPENALESLLPDFGKTLEHRYVNVKFFFSRAFDCNKNVKARDAILRLKHFQQEGIFESLYFDQSPAGSTWAATIERADDESLNIGTRSAVSYMGDFRTEPLEVTAVGACFGEGFVTAIDQLPQWKVKASTMLIYKGEPPAALVVNGTSYTVRAARLIPTTRVEDFDARPEPLLKRRNFARNRCVVQLALTSEETPLAPDGETPWQYLASNCAALLALLSKFRNNLVGRTNDVLGFHLSTVAQLATGILDVCAAPTMDRVAAKTIALAVAQVSTELNTLASVMFTGEWYQAFQRMRFGRSVLRRVTAQQQATDATVTENDLSYLVAALDIAGVPLRVLRAAASEVEPWAVVVDYVAVPTKDDARDTVPNITARARCQPPEAVIMSESFRFAQLEIPIFDAARHTVNGVLMWPPVPPRHAFLAAMVGTNKVKTPLSRQRLLQHFYAHVFTRNPMLVLRQQGIALQTVTWVRCTESILLRVRASQQPALQQQALRSVTGDAPLRDVIHFAMQLAQTIVPYFAARLREKRSAEVEPEEGLGAPQTSLNLDEHAASEDWIDAGAESDAAESAWDTCSAADSAAPVDLQRDVLTAPSLCQVLGLTLAAATAPGGSSTPKIVVETRFNLLAESIVRMIHAYSRSKQLSRDGLLQWLLGFSEQSATVEALLRGHFNGADVIDEAALLRACEALVDVDQVCRRTGKLFTFGLSNCTPFAVVAVLGLIDLIGDRATEAVVYDAFCASKAVSMRNFFERNAPDRTWDVQRTQVALFVFAAVTHDRGAQRPSFSSVMGLGARAGAADGAARLSPSGYTALVIVDMMRAFARKRAAAAAVGDRSAKRAARRAAVVAEEVLHCDRDHRVPRFFTASDVDSLNRQRAQSIKRGDVDAASTLPFDLLPTGLLRHHCCYPDCPMYLQCVATASDIRAITSGANPASRNGMRKHLQRNFDAGNCIPGFHRQARRIAATHPTFEHFTAKMNETFSCSGWYSKCARAGHLEANLRAAYDAVCCRSEDRAGGAPRTS